MDEKQHAYYRAVEVDIAPYVEFEFIARNANDAVIAGFDLDDPLILRGDKLPAPINGVSSVIIKDGQLVQRTDTQRYATQYDTEQRAKEAERAIYLHNSELRKQYVDIDGTPVPITKTTEAYILRKLLRELAAAEQLQPLTRPAPQLATLSAAPTTREATTMNASSTNTTTAFTTSKVLTDYLSITRQVDAAIDEQLGQLSNNTKRTAQ